MQVHIAAPAHETPSCPRTSAPWVLTATILGSAMVFIDGVVVNLLLPVIQRSLHADAVQLQWVVEGYTLVLASLLLVGGSAVDRFGRRRVFIAGTVLFAAASVWCGLAPDLNQLILARCVQGFGGMLLTPASLAILAASFDDKERGAAIGTWSAFSAVSAAIGPLIGGIIVAHASWRWVFFINVPIAAAVVAISLGHLTDAYDRTQTRKLDIPGAALVALGLGGIVFALIQSSLSGASPLVISAALIGVVALAGFLYVEGHAPEPMMPLTLFKNATFAGANALTLLLYGALSGAMYFLPFNLLQIQGYSTTAAGAVYLPFVGLMFLFSRPAGMLADRIGARLPLIIGPIIAGIGLALFALPAIGGSFWTTFFVPILVLGMGMSITVAPLTAVVMDALGRDNSGIASGINNAVSRVAGLVAIAAFGLLLWSAFNRSLDQHLGAIPLPVPARAAVDATRVQLAGAHVPAQVPADLRPAVQRAFAQSYVDAFKVVMMVCGGFGVVAGVIAFLTVRDPRKIRSV